MLPKRVLQAAAAVSLALAASCSSCIEEPASEVTFRIENTLEWPVYVRDEFLQAGLSFQREEGGTWGNLAEYAESSCDECAWACRDCSRALLPSTARRILPGESYDRIWKGEYLDEEQTSCLGRSLTCLGERRPAQPGFYRVNLCWSASLSTAVPDKTRFPAEFPQSLTCTSQEFELPPSGPVRIATVAPPPCQTEGDCLAGQLCLDGRCSAGCLPHDVPALGGEWNVEVGAPDDAGFFEVIPGPAGVKTYRGAGRVGSVRYQAGTTNLTLARTWQGLEMTATLYYALPGKRALPLALGDEVEVVLVDRAEAGGGRGIALRKAGALQLAADTGKSGMALPPSEIAPFAIDFEGPVFACNHSDCGKRSHRRMVFSAGDQKARLHPGEAGELTNGGVAYEAVAVGNYRNEVEGCGPSPMQPFLLLVKEAGR